MNYLPGKKYGVSSHNFVKKNVLCEKGDEITRFDGTDKTTLFLFCDKTKLKKVHEIFNLSILPPIHSMSTLAGQQLKNMKEFCVSKKGIKSPQKSTRKNCRRQCTLCTWLIAELGGSSGTN
jgi:hypothetical protein